MFPQEGKFQLGPRLGLGLVLGLRRLTSGLESRLGCVYVSLRPSQVDARFFLGSSGQTSTREQGRR